MRRILRCTSCGEYTMRKEHCDQPTINPLPPRYSPEDRYAAYRRKAKEQL